MDSAPPACIAIVVVLGALVVGGRWSLVRDTIADRLINHALSWDLGSLLGYVSVAGLGYPEFGQRVFFAVGMLGLSYCFGFTMLLNGAEPRTVRSRQRRYNACAAITGIVWLACASVEAAGVPLHRALDWEGALWAVVGVAVAGIGLLLVRACLRELRSGGPARHEKLTYLGLLTFGAYCVGTSLDSALRAAAGASSGVPRPMLVIGTFLAALSLISLVAIPLIHALVRRAEWDRTSRHCRRLRPLWQDLTTAVPEVVLHAAGFDQQDSASRLYRMTVEIGDALMQLKYFAPVADSDHSDPMHGYVMRIAAAVDRKRRGAPGTNHVPGPPILPPAVDRATNLANLLALSRAWSRVRGANAPERRASRKSGKWLPYLEPARLRR
ncbi:MAB_1171c family putative transporter [Nocardia brasiliensis]|uniref:MAB_1171c family putative transporter n=1 Tax=Nocardia brasiliensis TaxID=37326 RepID=UPI0024572AC8|nr:MAB_1171c family putative transporter [Nocardia brasiliensis]